MSDRAWIAASVLAGGIALWLSFSWQGAPYIGNDGYQYLDAASNIASGRCVCTWLAHFDEQVAAGHMPIPFTHFPPGYSLLMAALSKTRLPLEQAGYAISAAGFLLTIWLMWDIGLALGARPWIMALFSLLWTCNEAALAYAATVGTEAAFTAALVAVGALMVRDLKAGGRRPALLLGIGAAAGVSYWLRYAGLFLIPMAALYIVWRWHRNRETLPWAAAGLVTAGALTAALQIRNIVYTGSWKGGFSGGEKHGLRTVFIPAMKSFYHLVFGSRAVTRVDAWTGIFIAALLATAWVSWRAWRRREWMSGRKFLLPALAWMGLFALAYAGGIVLAALTSIASDFLRYLVPVYPLLLAVLAAVISVGSGYRRSLAIVPMVAAILVIQSRSLRLPPAPTPHAVAGAELQQEVRPGTSARQWLLDRLPPSGVIVSVNGQAVHYLLQRPTISVIEPEFSSRRMDDADFHSIMARYRSRYLLVFPGDTSFYSANQDTIPFLRDLTALHAPEWLTVAARTRNVVVYECRSCM